MDIHIYKEYMSNALPVIYRKTHFPIYTNMGFTFKSSSHVTAPPACRQRLKEPLNLNSNPTLWIIKAKDMMIRIEQLLQVLYYNLSEISHIYRDK